MRVCFLILPVITCLIISCGTPPAKDNNVSLDNSSLFLHHIANPTLLDYVKMYDSIYCNLPYAKERGISIDCDLFTTNIRYTIGYTTLSILSDAPMLKCEPINNRPVIMYINSLHGEVFVPAEVELQANKESIPETEYMHIQDVLNTRNHKQQGCGSQIISINDFVTWVLVFDKDKKLVKFHKMGVEPGD